MGIMKRLLLIILVLTASFHTPALAVHNDATAEEAGRVLLSYLLILACFNTTENYNLQVMGYNVSISKYEIGESTLLVVGTSIFDESITLQFYAKNPFIKNFTLICEMSFTQYGGEMYWVDGDYRSLGGHHTYSFTFSDERGEN